MTNHAIDPSINTGPFTEADLPIDDQGRIYHLQLKPEDIAPDILIVGDPHRAEMIGATFLHDLETEHEHRGLVTITGTASLTGQRVTVTTSGIGQPSLEIVVNELVILNEIDFESRSRKPSFPRLHIIRVGTSGALQASTPLGTSVITSYAIGLDNSGMFYDIDYADDHSRRIEDDLVHLVQHATRSGGRFSGRISPYVARADSLLVEGLVQAAEKLDAPAVRGLTVSAPGFNAAQGRDINRVPMTLPDWDQVLSAYDPGLDGQRIENMEMEASFLIHYMTGLGYRAAAVCAAIANRRADSMHTEYQQAVQNATQIALLALSTARQTESEGMP